MDKIMNKIFFLFTIGMSISSFVACGELDAIKKEDGSVITTSGADICGVGTRNIPYSNIGYHLGVGTPFYLENVDQTAAKEFLASFSSDFACMQTAAYTGVSMEVSFDFGNLEANHSMTHPRMALDYVIDTLGLDNETERLHFVANGAKYVDHQYTSNGSGYGSLFAMFYFDKSDVVITLKATRAAFKWSGDLTLSYTTSNGNSRFVEIGKFTNIPDASVNIN